MSSVDFRRMIGEVEFNQRLALASDDVRSLKADLAKASGMLLSAIDRHVPVVEGSLGKAAGTDWSSMRAKLATIHQQLHGSTN